MVTVGEISIGSRRSSVSSRNASSVLPATPTSQIGDMHTALERPHTTDSLAEHAKTTVSSHSTNPQDAARDVTSTVTDYEYVDEDMADIDDTDAAFEQSEPPLHPTIYKEDDGQSEAESDSSGSMPPLPSYTTSPTETPSAIRPGEDIITDTVGAIAIDSEGNIACGASSGGIGMKFRGRVGPAALVGVGAAVCPVNAEDKSKMCTACVTSGTGEHMATTLAASVCAERLYNSVKAKRAGGLEPCADDEAVKAMIEQDFMSMISESVGKGSVVW